VSRVPPFTIAWESSERENVKIVKPATLIKEASHQKDEQNIYLWTKEGAPGERVQTVREAYFFLFLFLKNSAQCQS